MSSIARFIRITCMTFFRYPGGKTKVRNQIITKLLESDLEKYREPFVGGGSIFLNLLAEKKFKQIWLNDKDPGISAIWTAVYKFPHKLKERIQDFVPSVNKYYEYKNEILAVKRYNVTDLAFKKIATHQMSYSGLGTKSGGPIGGKTQASKYTVDCRWSPDYICKKIDQYHNLLSNVNLVEERCTSYDFNKLFKYSKNCLMYLDPPYFEKGEQLYQFNFDFNEHKKLAECIYDFTGDFVLSYDSHAQIKKLYKDFKIKNLSLNYTIRQTENSNKHNELLISNY